MKTALFVDFDNVYLGLKKIDPLAAEMFATQPSRWLSWLESGLPEQGEPGEPPQAGNGRRSILVRKCYLNPATPHPYRSYLTRAGFEIIDCPTLTSQGKNSSDIRMVIDILDSLKHPTRFDEFMILPGDADFTPVLVRLRAHDRRTLILSTGTAAESYKSVCDGVLTEAVFLKQGLGLSVPGGAAPVPPLPPAAAAQVQELKGAILACVQQLVAKALHPVQLVRAAQEVIRVVGPGVLETQWAGAGSFKSLLCELNPVDTMLVTSIAPGYLLDPKRHTLSASLGSNTIVARVQQRARAPHLTQRQYARLFETLSEVLCEGPYQLSVTSKEVRDRLAARREDISRTSVSFVLQKLVQAPSPLGPKDWSALELALAFTRIIVDLCQHGKLGLLPEERSHIEDWLAGGVMGPQGLTPQASSLEAPSAPP